MAATGPRFRPRPLALVALLLGLTATAGAQTHTLLAGRLLDVEAGVLGPAALIRVEDGLIVAITEAADQPLPDDVIDLGDWTVLPGLIDAHTHLCDNTHTGAAWDPWSLSAPAFGIVGVVNARLMLDAGFTTVRNLSEPFYAGLAVRDAIARGDVPGPRVFASGPLIAMTGGHGDWGGWMGPPHDDTTPAEAVADGVDGVRRETRTHLRHGVDWIKLAATGGFDSAGTQPGAAAYTVEEMAAAVDEAAKRGLSVAAHAHGAAGIRNAILAGVRSIEHGTLLDDESIRLMLEHDVVLVPDLFAAHYDLVESGVDWTEKGFADGPAEYRAYAERVARAHAAGVRVAFGTDAGAAPHGRGAEQFALLVGAGLTPLEALRTATLEAAELLGVGELAGSVRVGRWADLVAVPGDPLTDVSVLIDVRFVMQAGVVQRWERGASDDPQSAAR